MKKHLTERKEMGAYRTLFLYFELNDEEEFDQSTRMTIFQFHELHALVKDQLKSKTGSPIFIRTNVCTFAVQFSHNFCRLD